MTKLTDKQTLILKHAAGYVDGAVLPLPDGLHLSAGALNGAPGALRKKGLAHKHDNGDWRVSDAGRAAVGASPIAADGKLAKVAARPHTKQARLVELLRRPEGATITEVQAETDWQAQSVRGAISGVCKKKLGLAVASELEEGRGRVYRIVSGGLADGPLLGCKRRRGDVRPRRLPRRPDRGLARRLRAPAAAWD